jgi:CubicO group peptidase (beta-lactamase class C family)
MGIPVASCFFISAFLIYVTFMLFVPINQTHTHLQFSGTKSVISALVGIAIHEGFIKGVDQGILDFYPEMREKNPTPNLEKLTVEHLLTMSSGHAFPVSPSPKPAHFPAL